MFRFNSSCVLSAETQVSLERERGEGGRDVIWRGGEEERRRGEEERRRGGEERRRGGEEKRRERNKTTQKLQIKTGRYVVVRN